MFDGYEAAAAEAARSATVVALRNLAKWHRDESKNHLKCSASAMRQHGLDADYYEQSAQALEHELIAKAGVSAGAFSSVCRGYTPQRGRFIEVLKPTGWEVFFPAG